MQQLTEIDLLRVCVSDVFALMGSYVKVCLVHDLAESIVGDITPHCGVSKEEKRNLEEVLVEYIYI